MNKITKQIIIVSVILIFLVPIVYFTYPKITGSTVRINADFLADEGWQLTETKDVDLGKVNYYSLNEDTELIIRLREYATESDAITAFDSYTHLKTINTPTQISYKDGAFHGIYINNAGIGVGPWLIFTVLDGKNLVEYIYTNQERGQEYSGNYDTDVAMLQEIAKKMLGP